MKKAIKDVVAGFEDAIAYMQGDKSRAVVTEYVITYNNVETVKNERKCRSSKKLKPLD
jgi:hypothetical protein